MQHWISKGKKDSFVSVLHFTWINSSMFWYLLTIKNPTRGRRRRISMGGEHATFLLGNQWGRGCTCVVAVRTVAIILRRFFFILVESGSDISLLVVSFTRCLVYSLRFPSCRTRKRRKYGWVEEAILDLFLYISKNVLSQQVCLIYNRL